MNLLSKIDQVYADVKANRWHWYFSIFCRITLALGFIPSGLTKIMGERFASGLTTNHPMGQYLEALHHTGYYYTFIGVVQVIAAILLLIPRTVFLGAILYLPIIVNICILSLAVRFDGSLVSSPLMVLANLYLLCWHYDKLKYILPLNKAAYQTGPLEPTKLSNIFPVKFFAGVVVTIGIVVFAVVNLHDTMPRNSLSDCQRQFEGTVQETAGFDFCDCIHNDGQLLKICLEEFENAEDIATSK